MNNPNTHPAPAMVYGGAPSFQDADHALSTAADLAERMAMADELATLRADNDARGVLIEQLRAELAATRAENAKALETRDQYYQSELAKVIDTRDRYFGFWQAMVKPLREAKAELSNARSELDAVREELTAAKMSVDLQRSANHRLRADRDQAHDRWQQCLRALNAALGEP